MFYFLKTLKLVVHLFMIEMEREGALRVGDFVCITKKESKVSV